MEFGLNDAFSRICGIPEKQVSKAIFWRVTLYNFFMKTIYMPKIKINCGLKNKNVVYSFCRYIHFVARAGG